MMKHLTVTFVFLGLFFIVKAQNSNLIGTWSIIEFTVINNEQTSKTTEDALKENKSVWDLAFLKDGTLKQTGNMRNGNMETQEGTWEISGSHLLFSLKFDNRNIKLDYKYELKDDMLVLVRSNPTGTMKIESKFKRNN